MDPMSLLKSLGEVPLKLLSEERLLLLLLLLIVAGSVPTILIELEWMPLPEALREIMLVKVAAGAALCFLVAFLYFRVLKWSEKRHRESEKRDKEKRDQVLQTQVCEFVKQLNSSDRYEMMIFTLFMNLSIKSMGWQRPKYVAIVTEHEFAEFPKDFRLKLVKSGIVTLNTSTTVRIDVLDVLYEIFATEVLELGGMHSALKVRALKQRFRMLAETK